MVLDCFLIPRTANPKTTAVYGPTNRGHAQFQHGGSHLLPTSPVNRTNANRSTSCSVVFLFLWVVFSLMGWDMKSRFACFQA